jgi:hypothetical protein
MFRDRHTLHPGISLLREPPPLISEDSEIKWTTAESSHGDGVGRRSRRPRSGGSFNIHRRRNLCRKNIVLESFAMDLTTA